MRFDKFDAATANLWSTNALETDRTQWRVSASACLDRVDQDALRRYIAAGTGMRAGVERSFHISSSPILSSLCSMICIIASLID
jgi:hypothetical protein